MRYLLFLFLILNSNVFASDLFSQKSDSLLRIDVPSITNKNPFLIYFDIDKEKNTLTRNTFKLHDTYLFADMMGAIKTCNNRWGGLPSRSEIGTLIKAISFNEFKAFNSGYLGGKQKFLFNVYQD